MRRRFAAVAFAFVIGSAAADSPAWDPIGRYAVERVEGWRVLVHKDLDSPNRRDLRDRTLKQLTDHLYRVSRVLPAPALDKIREIPIWVEVAHPRHPCMCYHPSAEWLRSHGMNPEKAKAVEIANCENFLSWTRDQPWMVLHELAHGYHNRVLGDDHAGIKAAYRAAVDSKTYESVLHVNGKKQRHYALTNEKEYFAETTEAYFGTNDFYPFVRGELKVHDPRGYALIDDVWGVNRRSKASD
jgi:hypothetical protein